MTDASFGADGYAVLIEDDPSQKFTSLRKSYAPVAYGSKTSTPEQINMSIYAKEFLAIYFAFKEFGHIFWGAPKPVIILTDNKAVTRFFQTKIIPPALWNACDYVIQFNFVIAHIPGAQNTAADYLSRLEADPKDKLVMKIREDVQTLPIEINVQSAGVSQEEQIFYTNDDDETEEQYWARKEAIRKNPATDEPTVTIQTLSTNLLPNLPPSGGYENVLTAIDVFSRYLFAYPLTDASAINVAKAIIDIMTKHAYLPTTLITDKGTAFTSAIIAEVTQILGKTLK